MLNKLRQLFKTIVDRKFWLFFGSGLIVSVAYMDPGNWGTAISGGAKFNYELLWIVWVASIMAMLFQYLSGKLGLAGYSLAELIRKRWKNKTLVFLYWILAEISILATDLAEFLGIVVALHLLFNIPMIIAVVIAILDVVLLLAATQRSFRTLEYLFILFVGVIGISYIIELILVKPDWGSVIFHSIVPSISADKMTIIVGIIGATVMPHALFVHSWLLKRKRNQNDVKKSIRFHTIENILALTIAGLINAAILIMSATAFFGTGIATIDEAYKTLLPLYGNIASVVFAIALLSAGLSSSITGMLSGQSIMDALTDFKLSPLMRRIITRVINAVPLLIAILLGIEPLDVLVYSQVVLSMLIPLPLLPLIYYTSKKDVMGVLVNKNITTITSYILSLVIIGLNAYLLYIEFT